MKADYESVFCAAVSDKAISSPAVSLVSRVRQA